MDPDLYAGAPEEIDNLGSKGARSAQYLLYMAREDGRCVDGTGVRFQSLEIL